MLYLHQIKALAYKQDFNDMHEDWKRLQGENATLTEKLHVKDLQLEQTHKLLHMVRLTGCMLKLLIGINIVAVCGHAQAYERDPECMICALKRCRYL